MMEALSNPIGFTEGILGIKGLHDWQKETLYEMSKEKYVRFALSAANNAGKSERCVVPIALWYAAIYPESLVIITAAVHRQIEDVIFYKLRQRAKCLPVTKDTATEIHLANGSRIIGFCTNQPGKFESWHNDNFLLIVDEAKSVEPQIFSAFDRCRPTHQLWISSPGEMSGEFYKAFTNANYKFKTKKITAYDCPHVPKEEIDYIINKYGIDHPITRSTIFAEFMANGSGYVISTTDVHNLLESPPVKLLGVKTAFIDPSGGGQDGDETAIAIMDGNKVLPVMAWIDENTTAIAADIIRKLKAEEVEAKNVWMDVGGAGKPIYDLMKSMGYTVNGVNNQNTAYDSEHYVHRGAEMWWDAAEMIKAKRIILPKGDDLLIDQLTTRYKAEGGKGKLAVETKKDMKSRGISSPDRADAVCGVISNFKWGFYKTTKETVDPFWEAFSQPEQNKGRRAGFDGGMY